MARTASIGPSGYNSYPDDEPLGLDLGLAAGEVADTAIERLLTHRVVLPTPMSIGVLHLPGARSRSWYTSGPVGEMTQALADSVIGALSRSPRVGRAAPLPLLLVGEKPTVAGLREGAARLQVQALLVYRPSCRLFERTPVVGVPQYRADCTVEATLLDTRSGVLPYTSVVTRDAITQRIKSDFQQDGTWRRVQGEALLKAGLEVASRVGTFLSSVPTADP